MKKVLSNCKPAVLSMFLSFLIYSGSAQSLNMGKDTISIAQAKATHEKYKQEMRNAGKKATTYVSFGVETLKEIIDRCAAAGVDSIQFLICTIRTNDTAQYAGNHPGLSAAAKRDLIGRQYLIIKVKRSAFMSQSGSQIGRPSFQSSIISLLASGFVLLDKPYGIAAESDYLYFGAGTICPPPASCN